jgi:hypothetical protein
MKEKYNKEGIIIETIKSEKEIELEKTTEVKHSLIWGVVILGVALLIYVMITYGKCAC